MARKTTIHVYNPATPTICHIPITPALEAAEQVYYRMKYLLHDSDPKADLWSSIKDVEFNLAPSIAPGWPTFTSSSSTSPRT